MNKLIFHSQMSEFYLSTSAIDEHWDKLIKPKLKFLGEYLYCCDNKETNSEVRVIASKRYSDLNSEEQQYFFHFVNGVVGVAENPNTLTPMEDELNTMQ